MKMKSKNDEVEILDTLRPDLEESEKVYKVRITGRPPGILMHNIEGMMKQMSASSVRKRNQKPTFQEDAENSAYRMKSGELYIPSKAMYGCIVNGGKGAKIGKFGAMGILATIRIFPMQIPLGTNDYEIDVQMAVVQHARIPRARPLIREWTIEFYVVFDSNYMRAEDLESIIKDAGKKVGILDFRPQHRGPYGTFKVESFEEVKS